MIINGSIGQKLTNEIASLGGVAAYWEGEIDQDYSSIDIPYNEGYTTYKWGIISVSSSVQEPYLYNTFIFKKGGETSFEIMSSSGTSSIFYIDMYSDTNILCHGDYMLYGHILFFY